MPSGRQEASPLRSYDSIIGRLEPYIDSLIRSRAEISKKVYGQEEIVDQLLVSLMSGGHVLIEGAPGLGKTLLVRTIGEVCGLRLSRIQFTPDLMPSDITGTIVLVHDQVGTAHPEFQPGPIFAEMVLADEINRATPKTQSALLEAMQERTVTVAGQGHDLPAPFFVLATQNPIEMEGTYVLPEAQVDRFFYKVKVGYPPEKMLDTILDMTTGNAEVTVQQVLSPQEILGLQSLTREVPVASHVRKAVVKFILSTQPNEGGVSKEVRTFVRFGITPRGGQCLILAAKAHALLDGRYNVSFRDLRAVLRPALRHRFQLNYEGEAQGISAEGLLQQLFENAIEKTAK